jgi:hypothetical protein
VPRPYDLRHSFASLLLAEGRTSIVVAAQLGHSKQMTDGTYGHVIDEYRDGANVVADDEIRTAKRTAGEPLRTDAQGAAAAEAATRSPRPDTEGTRNA